MRLAIPEGRGVRAPIRSSNGPARCRRKFLRAFPGAFRDPTYLEWERDYKWEAHLRWEEALGREHFEALLRAGRHDEAAAAAVRIESRVRHAMLFSFEKMALRDALKTLPAQRAFAEGLYDFLHGSDGIDVRFERWVEVIGQLPRRQTRVLTWPLATVFGFLAQPRVHFFFKPNVTRLAAQKYGFTLAYQSRPSWPVYRGVLDLARQVRRDLADLRPRDMIDIQSFLWVQGSDEYA
ncbi:MAG TPA: hypothetical protein VH301_16760 [Usitatibacter sp.]|jgi:hypothetical protein|nr:hypothetical protein [Usitatibacter sp.]